MRVWTDSVAFGELAAGSEAPWAAVTSPPPAALAPLIPRLYGERPLWSAEHPDRPTWPHLLLVETTGVSQFDQLVQLSRESLTLPDGTLCLAGGGRGLHGQRGRPWDARPGNIHLSLWLSPPADAVDTPLALLAMTAVAVVEAIDAFPGLAGRAGIKWVNDILIDGAKVCGILTHVARRPGTGLGIVGIGLNVEAVPDVPPTAFVPAVTALRRVAPEPETCRLDRVLSALLDSLARAYGSLRLDGPADLAARYRSRSLVIGREVAVCDEGSTTPRIVAEGRVVALGEGLELYLAGYPRPFTTGRLLFRDHSGP